MSDINLTHQITKEYKADKQKAQGDAFIAIIVIGFVLFALFSTISQKADSAPAQLASGVNECVAQCTVQ